jgi:hypothetical protein
MRLPGDPTVARPPAAAWPRWALWFLWVLLLTVLTSSVASSWEGIMERLAGAPAPAAGRAPVQAPSPASNEGTWQ